MTKLEGKVKAEGLESQQRRDNCRILWVNERVCNNRLLKDALQLDYIPTLDWAHRSLRRRPTQANHGEISLLQETADILRKAAQASPHHTQQQKNAHIPGLHCEGSQATSHFQLSKRVTTLMQGSKVWHSLTSCAQDYHS